MAIRAAATENNSSTPGIAPDGRPEPGSRPLIAPLSRWVQSRARRCFDIALVLAALPFVVPLCVLIGIAIRLSSRGPILFRQIRIGRQGRSFWIFKFRTMRHGERNGHGSITTIDNRRITRAGRILRHWKLDELPQLLNVLRGEMSLVGPRPRVPEQPVGRIDCLPGITGAASLAFVREEILLAGVPPRELNTYYARRVIPLKQLLDDEYMARATFFSDLRLIFLSVFMAWLTAERALPEARMAPGRHQSIGPALPGEGCD